MDCGGGPPGRNGVEGYCLRERNLGRGRQRRGRREPNRYCLDLAGGSASAPNYFNGRVAFANGVFVTAGGQNVATTTNGASWTNQKQTQAQALTGPAFGGGTWVLADDHFLTNDAVAVMTSGSASSWTPRVTSIPYAQPTSIAYGGGQFVVVGYGSLVATSPNGGTWTQQTIPGSDGLKAITYGNGAFVAVSSLGNAYRSTNGTTWTMASASPSGLDDVCFGGGKFMAVGSTAGIVLSADGTTWTRQPWPDPSSYFGLNACAFGNGHFIGVGASSGGYFAMSP